MAQWRKVIVSGSFHGTIFFDFRHSSITSSAQGGIGNNIFNG